MITLDSRYQDRLVSSEEAVRVIESGSTVVMVGASSEPVELVDALMSQAERLDNVRLITGNPLREPPYLRPGLEKHFTEILTLFPGGRLRKAVSEGRVGYVPYHSFLQPRLYSQDYLCPDVALIMVSPPDKHGFCSLGISA